MCIKMDLQIYEVGHELFSILVLKQNTRIYKKNNRKFQNI